MILHPRRAWSPHSSGSGKSAALGPRGTIHGRALLYVTVRPASLFSAVLPESAARTSSGCRRNFCRILQAAGAARISRRNDRAGGGGLLVLVAGCCLLVAAAGHSDAVLTRGGLHLGGQPPSAKMCAASLSFLPRQQARSYFQCTPSAVALAEARPLRQELLGGPSS